MPLILPVHKQVQRQSLPIEYTVRTPLSPKLGDQMHRQITNRLVKRGLDMVEIFRNRFRIYVLLGPPFYSALKLGI